MPALNPNIIRDTRKLISLYQTNLNFRAAFDRVTAKNINTTYLGRPIKLYVEVLANISSGYKADYAQVRKIVLQDTDRKVGELFAKVKPHDFFLLDSAAKSAQQGLNYSSYSAEEIEQINNIETGAQDRQEKREAYAKREIETPPAPQTPQLPPTPSLTTAGNWSAKVGSFFRKGAGGTAEKAVAGKAAAVSAGKIAAKLGINTVVKAGAGLLAKLGISALAGVATGGVGLIVGAVITLATTFGEQTKKLFKYIMLIVIALYLILFVSSSNQRGIKMNAFLPPYALPISGNVGIGTSTGVSPPVISPGGSCPNAATIIANSNPGACRYLNPNINIFDTNISQQAINTYISSYSSIFVSAGKGNLAEFTRRVNYIVDMSKQGGLNPVIFLGYWKSESLFSTVGNRDMGCAGSGFEEEVDCALGIKAFNNPAKNPIANCARSRNASSVACNALKSLRSSYDKTHPIQYPVSTFDDFAEAYGPYDHDPNNCTHTYNILLEEATKMGACISSPSPGPVVFNSYFCQSNPAWASSLIGSSGETMSSGGCGLTSIAMVLNYFGLSYTPAEILVKFIQNPSWYTPAGANMGLTLGWVESLGFEIVELNPDASALERDIPRYLNNGYLILGSQYIASPLSHIFIVSDSLSNGNVILQDPDKNCQPNLEKTITGIVDNYSRPTYGRWMYAKAIKKVR